MIYTYSILIIILLLLIILYLQFKKTYKNNDIIFMMNQITTLLSYIERLERTNKDDALKNRDEIRSMSRELTCAIEHQMQELSKVQHSNLELQSKSNSELNKMVFEKLNQLLTNSSLNSKELRGEVTSSLTSIHATTINSLKEISLKQKEQLVSISDSMNRMQQSTTQNLESLRNAVELKLQNIQSDNNKQLEEMRKTVDEKLQGTLEKRLGESFKQVSERLALLHKGIGEMQSLAIGVGDLKKVLSNIKTRGTWGEVQLESLLEQVLPSNQYFKNFSIKQNNERVDFAIKLPNQTYEDNNHIVLPIDAKFPLEDYQNLLSAQENGDISLIDLYSKQLERRIKDCAKSIFTKYIFPPKTTDFAIMFLPIEGLFAEVIRIPGLTDMIQRDFRVVIAGPTTLWSILNSLQMGFRTLAIQKRSSEVWILLDSIKNEWSKYGEALDKVRKKIDDASTSLDFVTTRSKVISNKLKKVESISDSDKTALLVYDEN